MEQKRFTAELKAVDERGVGRAVISTTGVVDADGDFVEPGAFGRQRVVFLRGHDWQSFPLGHAEIHEEGNKAIANLELNLTSSAGRAAYDWLKWDHERGGLQEFSYGFSVAPNGAETQRLGDGRTIRRLKSLRVHEVSMVVRGAGVGTGLVAIKGEGDLAAQTAAVVAGYERLLTKMVVQEFERSRAAPGEIGYTILNHADANHLYGRSVAVALVKEACDELKIPMAAAVEMFRETQAGEASDFHSEPGIGGLAYVSERKIYLRYDLRGRRLAELAGHEAYHLSHRGSSEQEAERFGRAFAVKALGDAPRPGSGWTGEQLVAAATWMRLQGVRM